MAGKHRREKVVHAPSKHMQSRWEKQKKQSRIIMICAIALIIIVAGLIGGGYYIDQVMPNQKIVVKVNDKSFDYDYYIKTLDLITKGIQSDGVAYYADLAVNAIQQGEMVREKAADAGVTATDEEVNNEVEKEGFPKGSLAATDLAKTRLLTRKYTEQVCVAKQPASVQQVEVDAMFLENKSLVDESKRRLLLGENFTKVADQLSSEPVTKGRKGYLGWIPKGYESYALGILTDSMLKDVIFSMEPKTYSDAIYDPGVSKQFGYWILEALEKDPTKGTLGRGILLSSKDQAEEVRVQLLNGGNWDDLAKQYSQAPNASSGADLGWVQVTNENAMLARILAAQDIKKISDVIRDDTVQTKGGYWLIYVVDAQDQPLVASIKQKLTEECLGAWIEGLMKDVKTENLLDDTQKTQAVEKVLKNRGQ